MQRITNFFLKYKSHFFATGLLLILLVILFHKLLDGSHQFIPSDTLAPKAIAQGMEDAKIENGEYPLWIPWLFSGLPSVHSFQYVSRYYLPHQVFLGLNKLGIPWFWTFGIHLMFAGFGVYLLLRSLKIDYLISIFGGISFMLTPYLITMIVHGHGSQMMTAAYIPWIMWAFLKLKRNQTLKNIGIFGLLLGLQLSRAHVQVAYYTWLMLGLAMVITMINWIRNRQSVDIKFIIYVIPALIISIGFAIDLYYPVSVYTPFSIRGSNSGGAAFDYATQWSFSFSEMMTFLIPSFYGFGGSLYQGSMPFTDYPNYMGILILLLAIYSSVSNFSKLKLILILTIIFSLLLSFGKHFFLYEIFYNYVPYFNKFRVPVMILILTQFSVSVLAAIGLHDLLESLANKNSKPALKKVIIGWVALVIILILFCNPILGIFGIKEIIRSQVIHDTIIMIAIISLGIALLYSFHKKWLKSKYVIFGILILSIFDLIIVDQKIIEPSKDSGRRSVLKKSNYLKSYLRTDEIINFLKNDESKYRVFPLGYLTNDNRWSAFQIESITGYHPAKLANYNNIMSEVGFNSPSILQMLNVKYLISLDPLNHPDFAEVFKGRYFIGGQYVPAIVYKYLNTLPRYFYAKNVKSVKDKTAQFELLKQRDFDPVNMAFVSSDFENITYSGIGELKSKSHEQDIIEINSTSDNEQFLILSEIYYPMGWVATVNNVPTEILETNGVLRGLQLPPGDNQIIVEFNPSDINIGKWISRISLVILILLIISGYLPRRNNV